jgi:hypothetical protein
VIEIGISLLNIVIIKIIYAYLHKIPSDELTKNLYEIFLVIYYNLY